MLEEANPTDFRTTVDRVHVSVAGREGNLQIIDIQ